jgi:hypothetical protein
MYGIAYSAIMREGIMQRIAEIAEIEDLDEQTTALVELLQVIQETEPALTHLRAQVVKKRRLRGESHRQIAEALGISRGRAQQIAEGKHTGRRPRPLPQDDSDAP